MEKEIKSLTRSVELIAGNTAKVLDRMNKIENNMATKAELIELKSELKSEIHDMRMDLKSFKKDTQDNFNEINEKLDDLSDTDTNYDKRIEKLENKVFA